MPQVRPDYVLYPCGTQAILHDVLKSGSQGPLIHAEGCWQDLTIHDEMINVAPSLYLLYKCINLLCSFSWVSFILV